MYLICSSKEISYHVIIEIYMDIGSSKLSQILYGSQNMNKIDERLKFTYTHEVNNGYYLHYPKFNYIWN